MSIYKQVSQDWATAMKAKSPDKTTLSTIRSELQLRAKNDLVAEVSDDVAIVVIGKLCEVYKESLGFAEQAAILYLVNQAELNIYVAQRYLPALLS